MRKLLIVILLILAIPELSYSQSRKRIREYGIEPGIMQTGKYNSITDVSGVSVGHFTLLKGDSVRTGVTAIIPHERNIFQEKVPAAMYIGNGFGKMTGYSQVEELGNIETPIILTNTLSVPVAADALIDYTISFSENKNIASVNPVVGETNDGGLNDIRGRHIKNKHVLAAINNAKTGRIMEGNVGAGTGTRCFGYKGGIGTSSRILPERAGNYTVGVLVQTNFGGFLSIDGVPVGEELRKINSIPGDPSPDGSCMMVICTDAPLDSRNLKRLAKRAMFGLVKTGGIASNGSGDYVIAFSTYKGNFVKYRTSSMFNETKSVRNDRMTALFTAAIEATEEAILNSLFAAETVTNKSGRKVEALPLDKVIEIMKKHNRIN